MDNVEITVNLTPEVATALAQYIKRTSWSDARKVATSHNEAYEMMEGLNAVMKALAEEGYAPR